MTPLLPWFPNSSHSCRSSGIAHTSQSQVCSAICCLLMSHSLPLPCRVSASLPTGQLSNVPWRRTGVKYLHNEVRSNAVHCFYGNRVMSSVRGCHGNHCSMLTYSLMYVCTYVAKSNDLTKRSPAIQMYFSCFMCHPQLLH